MCEGEDEGEQCVRGGRGRAVCEREGEHCESVVGVCIRCMEWNTVLCCVCRFWDFDRDENYSVDITQVSQVTSGEAVASIHADADRGAVGQGAVHGLCAV